MWYSGGLEISIPPLLKSKIRIKDCIFIKNRGKTGSHLYLTVKSNKSSKLDINKCLFTEGNGPLNIDGYGVAIVVQSKSGNDMKVNIKNSIFANNKRRGLQILQASRISIINCSISNNTGIGMFIKRQSRRKDTVVTAEISRTNFTSNSMALHLWLTLENKNKYQRINIIECQFRNHNIPNKLPTSVTKAIVLIEGTTEYSPCNQEHIVLIENCVFEGSHDVKGDCSSLYIMRMKHVTLKNSNFNNNNCTGIAAIASTIEIENQLNMTSNYGLDGGAIRLESREVVVQANDLSMLTFSPSSY